MFKFPWTSLQDCRKEFEKKKHKHDLFTFFYVLQKERSKEGHKEYICDMLLAPESDSAHEKQVMGVKFNDSLTWISINCNNLEVLLYMTASPSEVQHFKL